MDQQREILCWCDEERDMLFVYDDGSSITCLNNDLLFVPDSIKKVSPVKVRNSSDVYTRIQMSGEAYEFGNVRINLSRFCVHTMLSVTQILMFEKF